MEIFTKVLDGGGQHNLTVGALFVYAKETLGDGWTYTYDETTHNQQQLVFTDPTGSGDHGWRFESASTTPYLISNGIPTQDGDWGAISSNFNNFTGVVWKSSGGSVGIGYQDESGRYVTWYLLIKFNGKYENKDSYAVSYSRSSGHGMAMVHGVSNIGSVNQCVHGEIGTGVYLHPFYDPISGLTSSDVFGVQSMDSSANARNGFIIKQGGESYLSMLGGPETDVENTLFVKM